MNRFLIAAAGAALLALTACNDQPAASSGSAETAAKPAMGYQKDEAAKARARHRIDSLEAKIREAVKSPEKAPDVKLTMYMIQAYQYFAADFPQDPRAPEGLDRAGQLYSGVLHDPQRAAEYFDKAYQKYPDYPKRPQLLLQLGVACEEGGDTANAALAYQRLRAAYPQSPLAEQAAGLLKLLRMSDAERKKMFGAGRPPADAAARQ